MRRTGTTYQSKGRWFTGNFVRFFQDTIQPIGGWSARSWTGATISGVPRAMVSYRLNSDVQVLVIGTTRGLYAVSGTVVYDITPAAVVSNNANRIWQLDVFGAYLVAVDLIGPNTGGRAYYWTGNTAAVAANLDPYSTGSAPLTPLSVVATPERFLVMLGAKYTASGWSATGSESQSRMVTWATQEGGFSSAEWTPASTNTAGDFTLTTEGAIRCGRRTRGGTLIWTTTDLWVMQYIGGTLVYRFDQVGNKCGIIAPNAAIVSDTGAYWMGENGFYVYNGFVNPIPCEVHDYVFDSLNRTYAHYIWAIENPTFGEVTWFYPSAEATEVDRYVTFNYRENHWVTGSLERTCGVASQPGVHVYPVMAKANATVYDHETGSARASEGTPSLESGPMELGNGDALLSLQKVVPDDKTVGDVELTVYTAPNPDTAETANGPYTLTAHTTIRLKARQIRVKLTEAVATSWRVGVIRLGVQMSGRR